MGSHWGFFTWFWVIAACIAVIWIGTCIGYTIYVKRKAQKQAKAAEPGLVGQAAAAYAIYGNFNKSLVQSGLEQERNTYDRYLLQTGKMHTNVRNWLNSKSVLPIHIHELETSDVFLAQTENNR
jgi:hypothetical protein